MDELLRQLGVEQKFGLREFLKRYPALVELVFNASLRTLLGNLFSGPPQLIKSIYFDKPPAANWVVNWHQDLTINLQERKEATGYTNWRTTAARTVVQPDTPFLEHMITVRIHLDACTAENGALLVIPASHLLGVIDMKHWQRTEDDPEHICEVKRGGVLLMKPLMLHASRRTTGDLPRRVIHLEFTDLALPEGLAWKEVVKPDNGRKCGRSEVLTARKTPGCRR